MDVRTRNIIMYVVLGLVFLGALVGVIYGVATHSEAGLLEGVPQWQREDFPLRVCARSYAQDSVAEDDREVVEAVVSDVNHRLGDRPLGSNQWTLVMVEGEDADGPCVVVVTVGVPSEPGWMDPGGHSEIIHRGGRAERCDVVTSNTGGAGDLTRNVIYHEIGHCLGLAHDDVGIESNNIMKPTQRPTPDGVIPPWFSDDDRELLRELYRPR